MSFHDLRDFIHRINRDGCIRSVNEHWLAFAVENGWKISSGEIIGSLLMQQISGAEARHIYQLLIDRAWAQGRQSRFDYRCDSPDCRRFMEMRIRYDRSLYEVEFRSRVKRLEKREPINLLDHGQTRRTSKIIKMCSWCKAVQAGRSWIEVEQAMHSLGILESDVPPQISHFICPACRGRLLN